MFLYHHLNSTGQNFKTKIYQLTKIIEIAFPCFLFHSALLRDFVCHTFSLIQKKKNSMRWEKSMRALMINRDIFLTGLNTVLAKSV